MRHRGRVIATISIFLITAVAAVPLLGAQEAPPPAPAIASAAALPPTTARKATAPPAALPPMHRVDDADWVEGEHVEAFDDNPHSCTACHGAALEGTVRSRVTKRRLFHLPGEGRAPVALERGERVSCVACHDRPDLPESPKTAPLPR